MECQWYCQPESGVAMKAGDIHELSRVLGQLESGQKSLIAHVQSMSRDLRDVKRELPIVKADIAALKESAQNTEEHFSSTMKDRDETIKTILDDVGTLKMSRAKSMGFSAAIAVVVGAASAWVKDLLR